MAQADDAAVLARAKALANEDGFEWELDFARSAFGAPSLGANIF
jgi:hypothetical protein